MYIGGVNGENFVCDWEGLFGSCRVHINSEAGSYTSSKQSKFKRIIDIHALGFTFCNAIFFLDKHLHYLQHLYYTYRYIIMYSLHNHIRLTRHTCTTYNLHILYKITQWSTFNAVFLFVHKYQPLKTWVLIDPLGFFIIHVSAIGL